MNLVIVESPNKVKKIASILGDGYKIMASVGHVRDLPLKELGIDPPAFKLCYQPTERGKGVLEKLAAAARQADRVFLATDPDREGEAISWHLADALHLKNAERVTFTAITKEKIQAALKSPRQLDMRMVHAQEARRALDRIIGYRVSPVLSVVIGQRLSAGRVQSPAVRLVVDREREIAAFKITEHYSAELIFESQDGSWKAEWDTKPHLPEGENYLSDKRLAKLAAAVRNVSVAEFEDSEKSRPPSAPFTTSALQQAAGQRLKMKPKKTMELAQKLYEQGVITYHRTDAPNMDEEGEKDIAAWAQSAGLPLATKSRRWKAKEGAQEGHEAIRPTHVADTVCGETEEEKALYRLIWQRAVASQLADAIYAVRSVRLTGTAGDTPVSYKASGRSLITPGWLDIYADDSEEEEENQVNPIPALTTGTALSATGGRVLRKKTRPPVRFKEPSLVAEMERLGIGRPSTYASILDNITSRDYITTDKKGFLLPSSVGEKVRDVLTDGFNFIDLTYTRQLEDQLDQIAEGKTDYISVVSAAWEKLTNELAEAAPVAFPCPACGKPLRRISGKNGFFWGCTDRNCKTTLPDAEGKPGERKAPPPPTGFKCPKCGKELAHRTGMTKGEKPRPYDFYGCTGFPACTEKFKTGENGDPVFS